MRVTSENGLPVMLNIAGKVCVVVGGGNVAARKIAGLLEARAQVTLISPEIVDEIEPLLGKIRWEQQPYSAGMLQGRHPALVFAATNRPETNRQIAQEAHAIGALVNVADEFNESSFTNMTVIRRPPLTIALHTGATSPALAKHLATVLESAVGDEYAILARWLGDLRSPVRAQLQSQAQRQQLYESLLQSDILNRLQQKQIDRARQQFEALIQAWGIEL